MSYGLKKYSRNNYKNFKQKDIIRFYAALLRHTYLIISGEDIDKDSGLPHFTHVASNLNIIAYLEGAHGKPDFS
jgi:hypothetical protein